MSCNLTFLPKIDLCINNKCDSICVKELTDVVQQPYNTTGWGTGNPLTSDVTTATVSVYDYLGTDLLQTIVIKNTTTNLYPNTTPTPFVAYSNLTWDQPDGVYKVTYLVTTTTQTYSNGLQHSLFICNIENCLNTLIESVVKECNSNKLKELKTTIDQLEVIIYGIKTAFSCGDFLKVNNLIEASKVICDNICDCGCGDCK
jgi:hypothetical protein